MRSSALLLDLQKTLGDGIDPIQWAEGYVKELTRKEKEGRLEIIVRYSPAKLIVKGERRLFSAGYLFLQKIYHDLRIDKICRKIEDKYNFDFDLNSVLSRLVYGRIIFPASKLATLELSKKFIEQPNFEIQHIYRGLEVLAKETDFIQAELYKRSTHIIKRKTGVLYYDCTNYFFEIEQEEGLKQYSKSKENRPNPVVQMGLFMDGNGIPLAFSITKGNTNEQITLKPLEKKILSDFELSKFVVCTDAGLSSTDNRKYNSIGGRAFITTQSVKKLKKHLKDWALDGSGWLLPGSNGRPVEDRGQPGKPKIFNITKLDEEKYKKSTFYKERWIKEDGLEQKLIVTYSIKYRDYHRSIRAGQIERAEKLISSNPTKLKKVNQNDYKRFIAKTSVTSEGEVAEKELYSIDTTVIASEEIFDGFYAVCTNLDDDPAAIIKINHRRWEIEECFRIMKSEFKARPVYLKRDDRIEAHFITCFISLLIYRLLEKKLEEKFTCSQIIQGLRDMSLLEISREGYTPAYTRTDFTDALHESFGFRTDYQITSHARMKNIFKVSKV
ncbi:MAG: IS1634 family transposase [Tannerella sp.]|nr:IS1634 family transposase [Tannerella sp.]